MAALCPLPMLLLPSRSRRDGGSAMQTGDGGVCPRCGGSPTLPRISSSPAPSAAISRPVTCRTAASGSASSWSPRRCHRSKETAMAKSMYAVVGTWTLAEGRWEEQVQGLREQVAPLARQRPGFVAAYWLGDRTTGKASSTVILEDEEAARS